MSWQGKILRVNLTSGEVTPEPLNMEWANDYIGERGLGTKYLRENMDPKADPMGPDNVLIFATRKDMCAKQCWGEVGVSYEVAPETTD